MRVEVWAQFPTLSTSLLPIYPPCGQQRRQGDMRTPGICILFFSSPSSCYYSQHSLALRRLFAHLFRLGRDFQWVRSLALSVVAPLSAENLWLLTYHCRRRRRFGLCTRVARSLAHLLPPHPTPTPSPNFTLPLIEIVFGV